MNKHNPNKATLRDLFEYVINLPEGDEEAKEFAKACLTALDERNEKRRNTPSKKQVENADLCKEIIEAVKGSPSAVTASEIASRFNISVQKASALLRQGVASNELTDSSIKIKGKGAVKVYKAATAE